MTVLGCEMTKHLNTLTVKTNPNNYSAMCITYERWYGRHPFVSVSLYGAAIV